MFGDKATTGVQFYNSGVPRHNAMLQAFHDQAVSQKEAIDEAIRTGDMSKALTTGNQVVSTTGTGGGALRYQFLHDVLEHTSFAQEDAYLMKVIPKKKVPSTTIEWTNFNAYGGPGDGFVAETGSDGAFGVSGGDDSLARQFQRVKYVATQRTVGIVAEMVHNIAAPLTVAEQGATLEMIAKLNLACYWGAETTAVNQFNGLAEQILGWVRSNPTDQVIIYDMGGASLDKDALADIQAQNRLKYGKGTRLFMGVETLQDVQKNLYPESRYTEGTGSNTFGINMREYAGTQGRIRLEEDVMLRPNRPLAADGGAVLGIPRSASSVAADAGSTAFAITPFAACAAVAAGAGNFWVNANLNTDTAILGTAPAVPTGAGNQSNRLAAGSYIYGVSAVWKGLESLIWVNGASAAGTVTGATTISPTAGQVVKIDIDLTGPCITGLGSTIPLNEVRFRVYRAASTATSFSQFGFLFDIACPTSGNARGYDNGMYIPGSDNGFLITESKNGADGWALMQLCPMIKRPLPHLAMADLFAYLWFGTPLLWVPRHHMWLRNIGRR